MYHQFQAFYCHLPSHHLQPSGLIVLTIFVIIFAFNNNTIQLHNSILGHHIATKFCTCHDSFTVVACAKICGNHLIFLWKLNYISKEFELQIISITLSWCSLPIYTSLQKPPLVHTFFYLAKRLGEVQESKCRHHGNRRSWSGTNLYTFTRFCRWVIFL